MDNKNNYYICKLTDEEKNFVKVELNETDDNRAERIEEIRQWLLLSPDIVSRTGREGETAVIKRYCLVLFLIITLRGSVFHRCLKIHVIIFRTLSGSSNNSRS